MLLSRCAVLVALVVFPLLSSAQMLSNPNAAAKEQVVFRPPFLLKLRIDSQHYYEEKFQRIPYVADDSVYLFAGETFGVNFIMNGNQPSSIVYQPDSSKADVAFEFKQEQTPEGLVMLLVVRNAVKQRLLLDALMTVPGDKEVHETSVLPVGSGHTNTESWPHPIVQLMLRNFRFSESGSR